MRPRIKVITLGVSDLEKSLAFYRDGMGLATEGIIGTEFEDGAVVFFEMNDDLILALWPKQSLAKDCFGHSARIKSSFISKKTTAPSSNSVPMIPSVANPIPSR